MPRSVVASAGAREAFVTIQSVTVSSEDSGFPIETWSDLGTAWMEKIDVSGTEEFKASQLAAQYDTRWRMDYREDMDPDLIDVPKTRRLSHKGRQYDITSAGFLEPRKTIELRTIAR